MHKINIPPLMPLNIKPACSLSRFVGFYILITNITVTEIFMLEFKKLGFEDFENVKNYFDAFRQHSCDFTAGITFMWRDFYDMRIAYAGDDIVFMLTDDDCGAAFLPPAKKNFDIICKEIENYCKSRSIKMQFYSVAKNMLGDFRRLYSDCVYGAEEQWSDYIYEAEAIMKLEGKKYATQRNHINKFRRLYDDFTFNEITAGDVDECIDLMQNRMAEKDEVLASAEKEAVVDVLRNLDKYKMLTGVLRVNGEVAGFSCAEKIGDILTVHIEKADIRFDGAYPMLTHLFLEKYVDEDIKFVNREDDSGDEGLKKSKLSYHPCELLEKYFVEI